MAVSMEEVRAWLDVDEVDYPGAAAALGPESLPHVRELARGPDVMLASKAVYLAGVISDAETVPILSEAAQHPDARVRVSAAAGLRHLGVEDAGPLADSLLSDPDVGARKVTVNSVATFDSPAMTARLRTLAEQDPEPAIRSLAQRDSPED